MPGCDPAGAVAIDVPTLVADVIGAAQGVRRRATPNCAARWRGGATAHPIADSR
jgi:hypothetical protein